jgi:hypothetical protein
MNDAEDTEGAMKKCKECGDDCKRYRPGFVGLCAECAFWSLVDKTTSACGCWIWTGSLDKDGYGDFGVSMLDGHRERRAPRVSWCLTNGKITDGLRVLHNCEEFYQVGDKTNRLCVNPSHLRLGTDIDNVKDRDSRGRTARGDSSPSRLHPESRPRGDNHPARLHPEKLPRGDLHHARLHPEMLARGINNGLAKLNDDNVREIRLSGESVVALSGRFSVSKSTIEAVRRNLIWRHVV